MQFRVLFLGRTAAEGFSPQLPRANWIGPWSWGPRIEELPYLGYYTPLLHSPNTLTYLGLLLSPGEWPSGQWSDPVGAWQLRNEALRRRVPRTWNLHCKTKDKPPSGKENSIGASGIRAPLTHHESLFLLAPRAPAPPIHHECLSLRAPSLACPCYYWCAPLVSTYRRIARFRPTEFTSQSGCRNTWQQCIFAGVR